jgi:hypothetical protein
MVTLFEDFLLPSTVTRSLLAGLAVVLVFYFFFFIAVLWVPPMRPLLGMLAQFAPSAAAFVVAYKAPKYKALLAISLAVVPPAAVLLLYALRLCFFVHTPEHDRLALVLALVLLVANLLLCALVGIITSRLTADRGARR